MILKKELNNAIKTNSKRAELVYDTGIISSKQTKKGIQQLADIDMEVLIRLIAKKGVVSDDPTPTNIDPWPDNLTPLNRVKATEEIRIILDIYEDFTYTWLIPPQPVNIIFLTTASEEILSCLLPTDITRGFPECKLTSSRLIHNQLKCPLVISLPPGCYQRSLAGIITRLLQWITAYWVPFGCFPLSGNKMGIVSRTDLWGEVCLHAMEGRQPSPYYIESPL